MLKLALFFASVAGIAGTYGFTEVAADVACIAKVSFAMSIVVFQVVVALALLDVGANKTG